VLIITLPIEKVVRPNLTSRTGGAGPARQGQGTRHSIGHTSCGNKAVMLAFKDYALLKEMMKFGSYPWDFTIVNFEMSLQIYVSVVLVISSLCCEIELSKKFVAGSAN
jgi:hypothetical protein